MQNENKKTTVDFYSFISNLMEVASNLDNFYTYLKKHPEEMKLAQGLWERGKQYVIDEIHGEPAFFAAFPDLFKEAQTYCEEVEGNPEIDYKNLPIDNIIGVLEGIRTGAFTL